jgi:uncharacterized membrane protein YphA (DoxX/SURF4 family)
MDPKTIGYWATTGIFCAALGFGGFSSLSGAEEFHQEITGLGYPEYMLTILGVAKLTGVAALLAPGLPRLKEWAYAGFTFDLLGATASHAFAGDPIDATLKPLIVLGLAAVSYALRPGSRRLAGTGLPFAGESARTA